MKKKSTGIRTATGIAALNTVYYEKAMLANLKSATPFMRAFWECCCGKPAENEVQVRKGDKRFKRHRLCEGCFFRYTVMEAAGRAEEFWEAHSAQRVARTKHSGLGIVQS